MKIFQLIRSYYLIYRPIFFFLLGAFISIENYSQANEFTNSNETEIDLELLRLRPGFAAEIPLEVCKTEFPFNKLIARELSNSQEDLKFSLFTFTIKEFDPEKKSILVIAGGPGGLDNHKAASEISNIFKNYNVIFFHYRGGGCSSFLNTKKLDKFISSRLVVDDIEKIRQAYQINTWEIIVGFSYGTNIARMYAHNNETKVKNLILEGLDIIEGNDSESTETDEINPQDQIAKQNIIKIITDRYQATGILRQYVPEDKFKEFIQKTLPEYLENVTATQNYQLLGFWESYERTYKDYFTQQGQSIPRYLNRVTFSDITQLVYSSTDFSSDTIILSLIDQFLELGLPENFKKSMLLESENLSYFFFPFLNPHFIEAFKNESIVSSRVQFAMTKNDNTELSSNDFCSKTKTLVLNGTVDSATPLENVDQYLGDKNCASHPENKAIIIEGGGHSNLTTNKCLANLVVNLVEGNVNNESLKTCKQLNTIKSY